MTSRRQADPGDWIRIYPGERLVYWDGGAVGVGQRVYKSCRRAEGGAEGERDRMLAQATRYSGLKIDRRATWRDLCQAWVQAHDGVIGEALLRKRLSAINRWIEPLIGSEKLADTRLSTMLIPLDAVVLAKRQASTFDAVKDTVSVVAAWGRSRDLLPSDAIGSDSDRRPAIAALRRKLPGRPKKMTIDMSYTINEVPKWADVCDFADAVEACVSQQTGDTSLGYLHGCAVRLAAGSGVRMCELLALTIDDVDIAAGMAHIDKQLDRYEAWPLGSDMPTRLPKGDIIRTTAIWARVRSDVESLIADAKRRGEQVLGPRMPEMTWWADGWGRILGEARNDIGWEWQPHYLRHHYGSYCHATKEAGGLGIDGAQLQHRLGHAKLSTTLDTYVHATDAGDGWLG